MFPRFGPHVPEFRKWCMEISLIDPWAILHTNSATCATYAKMSDLLSEMGPRRDFPTVHCGDHIMGSSEPPEVATIKIQAENLVDIDTVLGPMLAKMDNTGQVGPVESLDGWSGHCGWQ